MESDYKITFEYFRVPDFDYLKTIKKGKPNSEHLVEYVRGKGFHGREIAMVSPLSNGGRVCCYIGDETRTAARGVADCSYSDNFCYKTGREIALGRALKKKNSL